ncbi:adenylate/guanylate cyclase domain-containing protein [Nocardioides litoris]|uniref:adenylate/guanylate cyclase domain-containing protein n=1 Tax=Nocardioides litoris TaxID=1926648 RepID=UPI001121A365|nr:adenylate/guanylate cyclase domain-containing protein [Nocardioides litoris]
MPQCAGCSHVSPPGAKFCVECGAPFSRRCASCGHLVPHGAKFCAECGEALAGGVPASPMPPVGGPPVSERRTTTLLFGDLVSFTSLSESRDPEDVRELLSEYFGVARTVVHRYGGTVEKFIGDAVMAVWGVPVSHEDDAERAVRAGLDLVTEVTALGRRIGAADLAMRVGVTTGSVAVTLGAVHQGMVAGDAVNTAARVQAAAAPGTVWVDQETRGLTAAAVSYADVGQHVMKGKAEPARLFRAEAVIAAVGGAQRVDGLEAPMAGRDEELRQVKELFHATQADRRSRVVLVTGVAGIGKSRLGWEWEKYADGLSDGVWWHRGRCLSYGDGVAFWAFAEMVRARLGILGSDDQGSSSQKVVDGLDRWASTPAEADWLRPRLEALLGTGDGTGFERPDLFAAWTTFLDRIGADGSPVTLLVEDLQHADAALLDLLEHLLETCSAALFVVALTRPELLEHRPSLASGRRASVVVLDPIEDDTMGTLVDALVRDLPPRARSAIVARAEGIPLYAVETVRALVDHGAVEVHGARHVFVDHDHARVDLDRLTAPTSLQTLIAARLDALTPVERRTAQDASLLGLSFTHEGLMALADVSGYELDRALSGLVRKGVVELQSDRQSSERGQYRFLQSLVREVAYGTLARRDRKARHLAAAAHLEDVGAEVSGSFDGVIAQHLLDALAASAVGDTDRQAVAVRARGRLVSSAERAEALGSPREALRSTQAALDLGGGPAEVAALQERAARVALRAGETSQAEVLAAAARAGHEGAGDRVGVARVMAVQAWIAVVLGRPEESVALGRAGLELLAPEDDVAVRIDLMAAQLNTRSTEELPDKLALAVEVLRLSELRGEPGGLIRAINRLAVLLADAGSSAAYTALLESCVTMAREHHQLPQLGRSLSNLASGTYAVDLDRAREQASEAVEVCRRAGDSYLTEVALTNATFAWWLAGDWDRLLLELGEWFEGREATGGEGPLRLKQIEVQLARGSELPELVLLDSGDPWEQAGNEITRALVEASAGQVRTAAERARRAALEVFGTGFTDEDLEVLLTPAVELQLRAGDIDGAERLLDVADGVPSARWKPLTHAEVARLRGMIAAARGQDPEAVLRDAVRRHESYGAPYLLARAKDELGRWLHRQGRTADSHLLSQGARETYRQLGAAAALGDLDAALGSPGETGAVGSDSAPG